MKHLLIITLYFPPTNAADMQRIRMSLPYFNELGWDAEVVTVDENFSDLPIDIWLSESVDPKVLVHKVKALPKNITSKLGLGSLALRSMYFYKKEVDKLLSTKKYDLIYFSTTQFPICILGTYWKKKFGIPFLIDMQDLWHSEYYKDKPKLERPKKYWFSYRLHKFLEPIAMKNVDGIISVSKGYIDVLRNRYPQLNEKPCEVITFGAYGLDFEIAKKHIKEIELSYTLTDEKLNIVYIGRGGYDMKDAIALLFTALKRGIDTDYELFEKVKFNFIGTSYAPNGFGKPTIKPIAVEMGVGNYIEEFTDRIGFYDSIGNLQQADGLLIIGSNDSSYTASKLYPYILTEKQVLAIFHPNSSASTIIKSCNAGKLISLSDDLDMAYQKLLLFIKDVKEKKKPIINWQAFEPYTAQSLTKKQVNVFDAIITKQK